MAAPVYICSTDLALSDSLVTLIGAHGIEAEPKRGRLSGIKCGEDQTIIIDLESDAENLYRDIDLLLNRADSPRLILLAGNRHGFDSTDSFDRGRVELLLPPIDPRQIVACLQKALVSP
jgi:hypothetical protein